VSGGMCAGRRAMAGPTLDAGRAVIGDEGGGIPDRREQAGRGAGGSLVDVDDRRGALVRTVGLPQLVAEAPLIGDEEHPAADAGELVHVGAGGTAGGVGNQPPSGGGGRTAPQARAVPALAAPA